MNRFDWPRMALTGAIILLFYYAAAFHWSNGLEETLKNITLLAVGFWLGSSKSSNDKSDAINRLSGDGGPSGNPGDPVSVTASGEGLDPEASRP